jgi:hypothetical protein
MRSLPPPAGRRRAALLPARARRPRAGRRPGAVRRQPPEQPARPGAREPRGGARGALPGQAHPVRRRQGRLAGARGRLGAGVPAAGRPGARRRQRRDVRGGARRARRRRRDRRVRRGGEPRRAATCRPLKTGPARPALGARASWGGAFPVVPVGHHLADRATSARRRSWWSASPWRGTTSPAARREPEAVRALTRRDDAALAAP